MKNPITPNPGGQINPDEILGRDVLIAEIWQILDGRNIYMNDLRRIGKTEILNKMVTDSPSGWLVSKRDLGGIRSAEEFTTRVYEDALKMMGKKKYALRRMGQWLGALNGVEVAGVLKLPDGSAAPWKDTLTRVFSDLHEVWEETQDRTVFLWDEIPFMLANILQDEGPERAMEILDTLRSLSQDYQGARLVITGSVGIHHVLTRLRNDGYNNSPLNTFERVSPGPLDHKHAVELSSRLFAGAGLICDDIAAAAETTASLTGCVPFYIHRLATRLPKGTKVNSKSIKLTLEKELTNTDGDWDLAHYRNRLQVYYPVGQDEKIALTILDTLTRSPLPQRELLNIVKSTVPDTDDEQIRDVIKRLTADHYLIRDATRNYCFYLEIVRHWWQIDRDL